MEKGNSNVNIGVNVGPNTQGLTFVDASVGLGYSSPTKQLWVNAGLSVGNVNRSENDTHFLVYIFLSGFAKDQVIINIIKEKDFLTIEIDLTDVPVEHFWMPKEIKPFKIVQSLIDIDTDKDIKANMKNGLLLVEIPKKYTVERKNLKF